MPAGVLWMVLVSAIALIGQAVVFGYMGLKGIRYDRRLSRTRVFEGEQIRYEETLENHKALPVPWLRVESEIPISLKFTNAQEEEEQDSHHHSALFFLWPLTKVVRRYDVTCQRRGVYQMNTVAMTVGDLFSFKVSMRSFSLGLSLLVYPKLLSPNEAQIPSTRLQGDLMVRRFINPDPFLYSGIRPYAPGDVMRDIHWRASARSAQLMIKQRDFTAQPKLMLILNIQPEELLWERISPESEAALEHAISLCATFAMRALDAGLQVGFGTNAQVRGSQNEVLFLHPKSGENQREEILEAMARMALVRQHNFHSYLSMMPLVDDTDFMVLTSYQSELIAKTAQRVRDRGNTVTFINIAH